MKSTKFLAYPTKKKKEKRTLEISVNFEKWNVLEKGQTVKVKIYKTGTTTLVD